MNIKQEFRKMIRVLRVSTQPRRKEFELMTKVVAVGVIVMGLIGVIVSAIFNSIDMISV